ncbi:MAG: DUF4411 family protein [Solirubrobacteraceae bacterium]
MRYLLDANIFIQAKNLHYGFDFCPAFWEWLGRENQDGKVFSIDRVRDELIAGDDQLASWADGHGPGFFLPPDDRVIPSLTQLSSWAYSQTYEPAAVSTFLQVADYYLIAHAHAHRFTVVTHEIAADTLKKIKIPNACIGLNVKCVSPYEMLRSEKARFLLGG